MAKNCLDGYLTPGCATCPDWANGSDDRGIGCATHYPIMWCGHFAKMFNEEREKQRKCKNCFYYDAKSKTCCVDSTKYVPRKHKCDSFMYA